MGKRHKWADVIIAWANGERVQFKNNIGHWVDYPLSIMGTPSFHDPHSEWRIKPRTIMIGDMEVPEPLREAPEYNTKFWVVVGLTGLDFILPMEWKGTESEVRWIERGIAHKTEEAAIAHAKALIKISGGTV